MAKVLIIERDSEVIESIERLLRVYNIETETALSHPNAIRYYTSDNLKAIILDAEMPTISTNRLVAEFDEIASRSSKSRCPLIFLYRKEETPRQLQLNQTPRSVCIRKPVSLVDLYRIIETLKLTSMSNGSEELVEDKLIRYTQFLEKSTKWLRQLNENINRSE